MGNVSSLDIGIPDATLSIESLLFSTVENSLNMGTSSWNQTPSAATGSVAMTTSAPGTSSTQSVETAPSTSTVQTPQILKAIECPVCYEPCTKPVLQCTNGHLVCNKCRIKINVCPLCKEHHSHSFRNLVAEEIGSLFLPQTKEPEPTTSQSPTLPGSESENPGTHGSSRSSSVSTAPHSSRSQSPQFMLAPSDSSGSNVSLRSASPPYNFRSRRQASTMETDRSENHLYNFRPTSRINSAPLNRTRPSAYNTRASRMVSATWTGRSRASAYNSRASRILSGNTMSGRPRLSAHNSRASRMFSGNTMSGRPRLSACNSRASRMLSGNTWLGRSRASERASRFLGGRCRDIFYFNTRTSFPARPRGPLYGPRARRTSERSRGPINNSSSAPMMLLFSDHSLDVNAGEEPEFEVDQPDTSIDNSGTSPFYQYFNMDMDIEWSDSDSDDDIFS